MTVIEVSTGYGGLWDSVLPGVAVLVALDLVLGAIAVIMLSRATSSKVR